MKSGTQTLTVPSLGMSEAATRRPIEARGLALSKGWGRVGGTLERTYTK